MIVTQGVHDISEEDYHADPCPHLSLSASIAKLLIDRSPRHAWHAHPRLNPNHESADSTTFDMGRLAHKLVLGAGSEIAVIEADDWRTNAAKAARADALADADACAIALADAHAFALATASANACAIACAIANVLI